MTSNPNERLALFSIGHSNHPLEVFLRLLRAAGIQVVADVRSSPYSKYVPQFNRDALDAALLKVGLQYQFLGRELGGRPDDPDCYDAEGYVLYQLVAESPLFVKAIERLDAERRNERVALMCSEENPGVCHRHLLIGRYLAGRGIPLLHIRSDGRLQTDDEIQKTGGKYVEVYQPSLFEAPAEVAWRSLRPILRKNKVEAEEELE
ncbi:MAG: DUF488 domain-containing protein [Gemmataceae bacterium]|nr:DUF488 domain-containing protein [Gemmataceae bacterium]